MLLRWNVIVWELRMKGDWLYGEYSVVIETPETKVGPAQDLAIPRGWKRISA
jgi:hypothetical protein